MRTKSGKIFTEDQVAEMVMQAAQVWHDHNMAPAGLPDPAMWSYAAKQQLLLQGGAVVYHTDQFTGFDFEAALNKIIAKGLIVLDDKKAKVDERPHKDLFPDLNNFEDVKEYILKTKIPANETLDKLNELLAYYQTKNIRRVVAPQQEKANGGPPDEPKDVQAARKIVADLKVSDFGTTTSQAKGGKYGQLIATQTRLNEVIGKGVRQGLPPAAILRFVQDEVKKLSDRGIR
jgi:hypothetical protein